MQHVKASSGLNKTPARRPACVGQAETYKFTHQANYTKSLRCTGWFCPVSTVAEALQRIFHDCCESRCSREWWRPVQTGSSLV
ncbi:hypothetical protein DPMN_175015 [Dreissena polymorpha]|uniref:Uncharacterized protein n=1 Tax=Dreissena polymorpha TaxID=45954 RepID=A0A9D4E5R6_DREPO|nr:hypothetical protein DPMN_175015 [Dreissena polymorpha]